VARVSREKRAGNPYSRLRVRKTIRLGNRDTIRVAPARAAFYSQLWRTAVGLVNQHIGTTAYLSN